MGIVLVHGYIPILKESIGILKTVLFTIVYSISQQMTVFMVVSCGVQDGTDTGTYMVEDANSSPDSSAHSRLEYVFVDSNNVWLNMISVNTYRELHLFKAPVDSF